MPRGKGFNNPESQARAVKASRSIVRKRRRSVTHSPKKAVEAIVIPIVCTGTVRTEIINRKEVKFTSCPPDCPAHNVFENPTFVRVRSEETQPKRNQPNRRAEG